MLVLNYRFNRCAVPLSPVSHARCSSFVLKCILFLLLRYFRMMSAAELGCASGTAVADVWSQVRLQEFADKAVQEKAYFIRRRLGDQSVQVSCKYYAFVCHFI